MRRLRGSLGRAAALVINQVDTAGDRRRPEDRERLRRCFPDSATPEENCFPQAETPEEGCFPRR
jgi:hypothetical protein